MRIIKRIPSLEILKNSVFVYPTETCYGLGCDMWNKGLVKRVYAIKNRALNKPVSVIVSDIKMAKRYVRFSDTALKLALQFWPGPLTLVLPMIGSSRSLALRVSSHPIPCRIVKKLDRPIIATSANVSGLDECYSILEVIHQFKNNKCEPDFIIDRGRLLKRPMSTVIKVIGKNVRVLREGAIKW